MTAYFFREAEEVGRVFRGGAACWRTVFIVRTSSSNGWRKRAARWRTCPISQQFLGSGTMPWKRTVAAGVNTAAGTDFAAGDSLFVPDVFNCAYKVHINEAGEAGTSLHPAELLHLGTVGGAHALDLEQRIGNFDPGREADMVIIDPSRWRSLEDSLDWGLSVDDPVKRSRGRLFIVLMACNEIAVTVTYVRGRRLSTSQ
jgi:guanine deaminase